MKVFKLLMQEFQVARADGILLGNSAENPRDKVEILAGPWEGIQPEA